MSLASSLHFENYFSVWGWECEKIPQKELRKDIILEEARDGEKLNEALN